VTISRKNRGAVQKLPNMSTRVDLEGTTSSLHAEREVLIGILETPSQSRNINEYLEQLVEHVRNYSGCRCAGIRLLDDDGNIPYTSYTGFSPEFYESESTLCIKSDKCMCVNVIKGDTDPRLPFYTDGGSFLSNGTTKLLSSLSGKIKGQTRGMCNQFGYESLALVPMRHKGRIMGLIHLADESENKIPLETVRFLERVGAYVGEALHAFIAEETLRHLEHRYRTTLDSARDGMVIIDADRIIVDANPAFLAALGCDSREQVIGTPMVDYLAPSTRQKLDAGMRDTITKKLREGKGYAVNVEMLALTRDGRKFPVETNFSQLSDESGQPAGSLIVSRDITERKRAEEMLRESEEKFSKAFHSSPIPMVIAVLEDGRAIELNESLLHMTGYCREELIGRKRGELGFWVNPENHARIVQVLHDQGQIRDREEEFRIKSGEIRTALTSAEIVQIGDELCALYIFNDITERKRAEKMLRESEERFRALTETTSDWIWEVNTDGVYTYASPKVKDLLGYEPKEITGKTPFDLMPPEEGKHIAEEFQVIVESQSSFLRLENINLHKDGRLIVVETSGEPFFDANGRLGGYRGVDRDITERKRAEEALQESEELYRVLTENMVDVIWTTDMNLRITYISPSVMYLLGYSVEEAMSQTIEKLLTPSSLELSMKTLAEEMARENIEQEESRTYRTLELELKCKDGSTVWSETMVMYLRNPNGQITGIHGVSRDITERKKMGEELIRLSNAVKMSTDSIVIGDINAKIIDVNEATLELYGTDDKGDLIGENSFDLIAPEDQEKAFVGMNEVLEKGYIRGEQYYIMMKDGRRVPVEMSVAMMKSMDGKPIGFVAISRDITERKKLDQLKDEFIGLVSHELRTPLTVVMGAINTVLSEQAYLSQEETHQLLQDAAVEAESLSHLLGNLLELSRAQADRLFLYAEPVHIENVAQYAVEKTRRQSSAHRFVMDFPKGLPSVHADQLRLERILYNLLENAVKYSPQGGEIRVFAKLEGEYLVIGVSDQGIGISPHNQARLFGVFQRLEDPSLEGVKGAGLGLLVCRRLVEAHGGRIWVQSEPGLGSTFFFTVPLRDAAT